MYKKTIPLTTTSAFHGVRGTRLPAFPRDLRGLGTYLQTINPAIDVGIVTKSSREELKMNKLRLIITFLNLYRLLEATPLSTLRPEIQVLSASGVFGVRFLKILDFLTLAKDRYAIEPDSLERFYQSENMFHSESYDNPVKAKAIIDSFLELFPPNGDATDRPRTEKRRTWSGSNDSGNTLSFSASAKELKAASGLSTLQIDWKKPCH